MTDRRDVLAVTAGMPERRLAEGEVLFGQGEDDGISVACSARVFHMSLYANNRDGPLITLPIHVFSSLSAASMSAW